MQIERITARGQLVPLVFMQDAVAASQSDVQLPISEETSLVVGVTMPFAGQIVAVSADLSAAGSAGSLSIAPTINGTETTDPALTITTETSVSDICPRGTNKFDAGDIIGAELTSAAGWNGTTADLAVTVWVLLEVEGI